MIFAALAGALALLGCGPILGAERLWQSPATRYVMVGETHGTQEAPELFAGLVCAASRTRPVIVALEQPPADQLAIDTFLKSNGDTNARKAFLRAGMWNGPGRDGRSSQAMLGLFGRLREMKRLGRIKSIVAFQNYDLSVPFSNANEGINRGMATALKRAAAPNSQALLLAYSGSVHASLEDVTGTRIHSAAGRLPRSQTVTVFIDGEDGSAWNCSDAQCRGGAVAVSQATAVCKAGVRELVPLPKGGQPLGFDAVACVGKPLTASPPAVPLAAK